MKKEEEKMKKTRLGISVGLLGASIYFMGLFSGYLVVILLTGYILLFETNEWLKKTAVKAVLILSFFSLLVAIINLLPNAINFINNIAAIFNRNFTVVILSRIVAVIVSALDLIETILFILLGVKALNQGTMSFPMVDKLITKYME